MTPDNVAIVRGAYEAFKNGELEYMKNYATPDFVMKTSSATDAAQHYGPQAIEEIARVINARWGSSAWSRWSSTSKAIESWF